ncbi:hypothetical protein SEA_STEAMY_62 [Mycobacterium phage Steamy]|uniref:Uncharacterized protein n=1 Tax=Mycobacterium phage Steamy TaxID=2250309 RepID=A0A345L0N4_9CAUD|nr:hypothetical protein KIV62_gp39 [Mycobacterium phage Steamy]AXH48836.1 hypothetical protein SEA_STEAMY_62 [Mycobacterium phage Steamy]
MATPNAMPKRTNPLHQQILAGLLATKPVSWIHKSIDPESPDPKKPRVIETKVVGRGLVNALAANVSDANIERAAKRWIA